MKRNDYYPPRIGDQIVWLQNFGNTLPGKATALTLDPDDVAAQVLNAQNGVYGLNDFRGAIAAGVSGCYDCIEENLYGSGTGNVVWGGIPAPTPIPAAVAKGCVNAIFRFVADTIKTSPGYTDAIGAELGVVGPEAGEPDPETTVPAFDLVLTTGGKLEVRWKKGVFDGVKLEFDLGAAGMKSDIDLRPSYTLNWLPAAGQSAVVRVRLLYILRGDDFGQWSDWATFTLTGD